MFFFDTYALIEIAIANPAFNPYIDFPYVTSVLNIGEFYAYLTRAYGSETAKERLQSYNFEVPELTKELMMTATEFKMKHAKKELSWADCVGYVLAQKLGLKFLTGDSQFNGLPGVQFVK